MLRFLRFLHVFVQMNENQSEKKSLGTHPDICLMDCIQILTDYFTTFWSMILEV